MFSQVSSACHATCYGWAVHFGMFTFRHRAPCTSCCTSICTRKYHHVKQPPFCKGGWVRVRIDSTAVCSLQVWPTNQVVPGHLRIGGGGGERREARHGLEKELLCWIGSGGSPTRLHQSCRVPVPHSTWHDLVWPLANHWHNSSSLPAVWFSSCDCPAIKYWPWTFERHFFLFKQLDNG